MAIIEIKQDERPGILKEIDEGAYDLMIQLSQVDIYSFPIRSFIRETISNGLDAIIERQIYEAIEAGKPIEEYFLQRTDEKLLKDSSYDPEYYKKEYLSDDDKVYVTYEQHSPRDLIVIKDYGTGLGGSRLKGYFKIGYSSKRNMKDVIGKFGSGSKSALATGVDYFIMHTVYNGFKTSFMIFNNDYEAITPQHPLGKIETWRVKMSDGSIHDKDIYWEPSSSKNMVQIDLEVKKHNKNSFISSVKNQFQYFDGRVQLTSPDYNGDIEINYLKETPLYESDALLIPKYSTYSTPHILVDGISYGVINWDELELETRTGKIAIKVKATDVDITQSRETLKYTEKTKKTILKLIEIASDEATAYITSLLEVADPKNLFKMNNIYGRMSKNGDTATSAVFSKFLSMHNLKPKFIIESDKLGKIQGKLDSDLFKFLFYDYKIRIVKLVYGNNKISLETEDASTFSDLRYKKIIYANHSSLGPKLSNHLMQKYDTESFIYIRPRSDRSKTTNEYKGKDYSVFGVNSYMISLLEQYSDLFLDTYDVVYDEEDSSTDLEGVVVKKSLTLAQERRLNQEVIYTYYEDVSLKYDMFDYTWGESYISSRIRETVKVIDLEDHFAGYDLIISTGKYRNLAKIVELSQHISRGNELIIYVSQDNLKHFLPYGTLITDYFRTINNKTGELVIGEHIRNLNTIKHLKQTLDAYPKFSRINSVCKTFTDIDYNRVASIRSNSNDYDLKEILEKGYGMDQELIDDIFKYLDVLTRFHHVVKTGNKELISKSALEMFNTDEVYQVDAYDEEFINKIDSELKRISVISPLLELFDDYTDFGKKAKKLINLLITIKNKENESDI